MFRDTEKRVHVLTGIPGAFEACFAVLEIQRRQVAAPVGHCKLDGHRAQRALSTVLIEFKCGDVRDAAAGFHAFPVFRLDGGLDEFTFVPQVLGFLARCRGTGSAQDRFVGFFLQHKGVYAPAGLLDGAIPCF